MGGFSQKSKIQKAKLIITPSNDPENPLKGMVVCLNIFVQNKECNESYRKSVEKLGGRTTPGVRAKETNIVVWRQGNRGIWEKASKMGLPIVTPLWINHCEKLMK